MNLDNLVATQVRNDLFFFGRKVRNDFEQDSAVEICRT